MKVCEHAKAPAAIACRELWKIFGPHPLRTFARIQRERLGKNEVLETLGSVIAVADVSFTVSHGEIFCIMGLSGSGKSTLLRLLNRLIEPTAGQVHILGQDIGRLAPAELRTLRVEKLGMVFQSMALFPHRSVRDNVAFPLELQGVPLHARYEIAERKLDLVGLAAWADRRPHQLSGGMQQRVGLARALAADPAILLMDEPFSALDPVIRRQLQGQFLELVRALQKTVVCITHDLDEAIRLGDRIAIMKDGAFVQVGTPEDIVMNPRDEYVAEFVQGVVRPHVVSARTVMEPLDVWRGTEDLEACPAAPPHATLDRLIVLLVKNDKPVVIRSHGRILGIVTARAVLRALRGGRDGS